MGYQLPSRLCAELVEQDCVVCIHHCLHSGPSDLGSSCMFGEECMISYCNLHDMSISCLLPPESKDLFRIRGTIRIKIHSPTTMRLNSKPFLRNFFLCCSSTVSNPTYPSSAVCSAPHRVVVVCSRSINRSLNSCRFNTPAEIIQF